MKRRFQKAIRDTGSLARIPDGDGKAFAASIQPLRVDLDACTETGTGLLHRYKIYTAYDEITASLRDGSVLEYRGGKYLVESMDSLYFGGEPVFRHGILVAVNEGEA